MINENTNMQAASPAFETHRLFALVGTGVTALQWFAWIIILVSALNIFLLLSNMLNQSIYEIAVIRALGATKIKVMVLLLLQGLWLSLAGWLTGIIFAKATLVLVSSAIVGAVGSVPFLTGYDFLLLAYALLAGMLASLPPAVSAYRSDVHFILNGE
jgi:putative ABC transport system permease protein